MSKEELLYDILTAVPSSRSITEVSKKLFLSQPYISQVIHSAEQKYRVELVDRSTLPIHLTNAGETIIKDLVAIIENQNKMQLDLLPFQANDHSFIRIAFNQPWVISIGDELARKIQYEFPNEHFEIVEQTSSVVEKKLETQETNLFAGKMFNNPELISNYIFRQRLFFVIPARNPLFKDLKDRTTIKKSDLKKLNNQPFIGLIDESFSQEMIDHMFQDNSINVNKYIKVNNTLTATQMAIEGMGITISLFDTVKDRLNYDNYQFKIIEIPKEILRLDLGVSYSIHASTYVKKVAKVLKNILKEMAISKDEY